MKTIAGRVAMVRDMGKLKFLVIRDRTGDLQLVCNEQDMNEPDVALLREIDLGDIVAANGRVGTTKKGEVSIFVERLALLTKSLRPPPEKWHGIQDPELKIRQRYVQLFAEPASRDALKARAKALAAFRTYLNERDFLEVETPVLHATAGGAIARPFTTHHEALDIDLYLRIALELYLKRLLVGGLERVYEIGRNFRNEGIDRDHNPEFTMLEAYQAYGDYETMMELVESLVKAAALAVRDSLRFEYRGREMDLESTWRRVTSEKGITVRAALANYKKAVEGGILPPYPSAVWESDHHNKALGRSEIFRQQARQHDNGSRGIWQRNRLRF